MNYTDRMRVAWSLLVATLHVLLGVPMSRASCKSLIHGCSKYASSCSASGGRGAEEQQEEDDEAAASDDEGGSEQLPSVRLVCSMVGLLWINLVWTSALLYRNGAQYYVAVSRATESAAAAALPALRRAKAYVWVRTSRFWGRCSAATVISEAVVR